MQTQKSSFQFTGFVQHWNIFQDFVAWSENTFMTCPNSNTPAPQVNQEIITRASETP